MIQATTTIEIKCQPVTYSNKNNNKNDNAIPKPSIVTAYSTKQIQLGFLEQWSKRKATNVEMGAVVSLWVVSIIVRYLQDVSFERMEFELMDWRFIHHIEMRTGLFYMDSDYLENNHNWGTYFFYETQDSAVIWYWTNHRRWLEAQSILNESETQSYSTDRDVIDIWYSPSLQKVWAEALVGSTRYSTNHRRRNQILILNNTANGSV